MRVYTFIYRHELYNITKHKALNSFSRYCSPFPVLFPMDCLCSSIPTASLHWKHYFCEFHHQPQLGLNLYIFNGERKNRPSKLEV